MAHEEQLKNQSYKRWIYGSLAFKYLGNGLVETVDIIVKNQHDHFVKGLQCSECDQCSLNTLSPSHLKDGNKCPKGRSKCFCFVHSRNRQPCPNSFCGHLYDSIVTNHLYSEPNWSNTDVSKWGSNYLEIAKCYIDAAGYRDKQNIQDIDCSGLLHIIINNRAFYSVTQSITHFIQARKDRNIVIHSSNMELSEDELKSIADNMLILLNLPEITDTDGQTKLSIENIQKIRDGNIYISEKDLEEVENEYRRKQQSKEELQNNLCDYYKRCLSNIPVSPVLKTISGSVDEVFVEFSIKTTLTDKHKPEEQVNLYKDILFKDGTMCKNVYLLGEAGMGKTTWCKKFLNIWMKACGSCSGNSKSSLESKAGETSKQNETHAEKVDADVLFLRQFDILFYIALRQESKHVHIIDMIKHHPVVSEYTMQSVVKDILESEPQSCIILLDGLDEWGPREETHVPSRKGLHGCTVVTTSRKYRLVGIDAADNPFLPDRLIEMTGIRNKELLIRNIIRQLKGVIKKSREEEDYNVSEEEHKRFIADVKKMKDREISYQKELPGYMDIPLMLIVMVCLWFDRDEIDETITKNIAGMIEFMFRYAEGFQQENFSKKRQKVITKNLDELKSEWSKSAETLPFQLKEKNMFVSYSGLVCKVSKFAFDSLYNAKLKVRLTFSEKDLRKYFSEDELHVILKIGLLSQSEVTESLLCPTTKLSFIHKLFHEYLAGVYLAIQFKSQNEESITTTVDMLTNYLKNPIGNHLSNIDNATCFVGGIDPEAGSRMSEMLFNALQVAPEVFNAHSDYFNTFYLRQVQVVYENNENYPSTEFPIYTELISVPNKLEKEKVKYLHLLLKTNIKHLRKVEMPCRTSSEILENFRHREFSEMLTICIYDVIPTTKIKSTIGSLRSCVPELQFLEFRGPSDVSLESKESDYIDFTCCRLKRLELKHLSRITILVNSSTKVECDDSTKAEIKSPIVEDRE